MLLTGVFAAAATCLSVFSLVTVIVILMAAINRNSTTRTGIPMLVKLFNCLSSILVTYKGFYRRSVSLL